MLQQLTHPNIVKLYDTCEIGTKDEKYGLLFMEKCSSGYRFPYQVLRSTYYKKIKAKI
jgi:serine/threonine protein kinase